MVNLGGFMWASSLWKGHLKFQKRAGAAQGKGQ